MKIECVKQYLKDALLTAERFTGKQLSLPVLRYVLLIAGERTLKIRATNLDIGIEIEVPAKIEKEGVLAVPGDTLGGFLSNLPGEKSVTLEQVGQHITLSGRSYSALIKGTGYEDFPTIPFITKGPSFSLDAKVISDAFRSTAFAAALSDIKPEFSSLYCHSEEGTLTVVATDSSRLAEKKIPLKKKIDETSFLVPVKNVTEILRALETVDGEVEIFATKNQISFNTTTMKITSRLTDGNFPDYRQIIPKQTTTEAVFLKQDIIDRLKLTTMFSGKLQQVRMKIYPEEAMFEIESRNDEVGETSQQIDATLTGTDHEFLINQRYIADMLQFIKSDSISLSASGSGKPIVIRGVGDRTFTYLIMPMKG